MQPIKSSKLCFWVLWWSYMCAPWVMYMMYMLCSAVVLPTKVNRVFWGSYSSQTLYQNLHHRSCPSLKPNYTRSILSNQISQHFYCYFKAIVYVWFRSILDWSSGSGWLFLFPCPITVCIPRGNTDKKTEIFAQFLQWSSFCETTQVRKNGWERCSLHGLLVPYP